MIKTLLKRIARKRGYEILGPVYSFAPQRSLRGLLRQEQINLVLDVGANIGQFASDLRELEYSGRIVSFEPLSSAHAKLRNKAKDYPNWTVADRTAIGATSGTAEIHVSENSFSSSLLDILPTHSKASPESAYVGTETVPVNRLDDLCPVSEEDRTLLKIDVQGYEKQVLDGAVQVLAHCRAVITEMSLVPLYAGQVLAGDLWDLLESQGFKPWAMEPGFRDPATGRMLQIDGFFVR